MTTVDAYVEEISKRHPWYREYNQLVEVWDKKYRSLSSEEKEKLQPKVPYVSVDDVLSLAHAIIKQPDIKEIYLRRIEQKKLNPDIVFCSKETEILESFRVFFLLAHERTPDPRPYLYVPLLLWKYFSGEIASLDGDEARAIVSKSLAVIK